MKLSFALAGLVALGGVAIAPGSASAAMPVGSSPLAAQSAAVEQVRLVCDVYGRCFRRPNFGYYGGGPRFYGGYGRPRYYGGYGYGRPRFYGGGYRRF